MEMTYTFNIHNKWNHLGWKGPLEDPLVQAPTLPSTISSQLFNTFADGSSTTSLDNLIQCLTTLAVKKSVQLKFHGV